MRDDRSRLVPATVMAVAVVTLGLVTGLAASASRLPGAPDTAVIVADVAAGWAFALLGAFLWVRYPGSTVGPLAIGVGAASFVADLRWFETTVTWTVGSMATDLHLVVLAWLILAFPTGRLTSRERVLVTTMTTYFVALAVAGHLFVDPLPGCVECPDSFMLIRPDPELASLIWDIGQLVNLGLVGVLAGMIGRKWSSASPPARRALAPVVWALGPIALALAAAFSEPLLGLDADIGKWILLAERLALLAFPVALLAGMLRTRIAKGNVATLARALDEAVTPDELEEMVRVALSDPSARLAFSIPASESLIDAHGDPTELGRDEAMTPVEHRGERLGVIIHDAHVERELVESVGATASLALHNERLRAELRRTLTEVAESRERIAEAALDERRRIERDLHDGAQQRLLALGTVLGQIRSKANPETAELLENAIEDLHATADELRQLARGIHPSILTERGLGPAVRALAERAPLVVEVQVETERCRPSSEAAAYFLIAEALTNAVRHSGATTVRIAAEHIGSDLQVRVDDDGRGGADIRGGGLGGLADRLDALGGRLDVSSPPNRGTIVTGVLPCA